MAKLLWLVMTVLLCGLSARAAVQMQVGVDDAGSKTCVFDDPSATYAFEQIGFTAPKDNGCIRVAVRTINHAPEDK